MKQITTIQPNGGLTYVRLLPAASRRYRWIGQGVIARIGSILLG